MRRGPVSSVKPFHPYNYIPQPEHISPHIFNGSASSAPIGFAHVNDNVLPFFLCSVIIEVHPIDWAPKNFLEEKAT